MSFVSVRTEEADQNVHLFRTGHAATDRPVENRHLIYTALGRQSSTTANSAPIHLRAKPFRERQCQAGPRSYG